MDCLPTINSEEPNLSLILREPGPRVEANQIRAFSLRGAEMKHHEVTLEQVTRLANGMGLEGIGQLCNYLPEVGSKYGTRTLGQIEAFLNMINPSDFDKILFGEGVIRVETVIKSLFDTIGRAIPPRGFAPRFTNENRDFYLISQVDGRDDDDCLRRAKEYLPEYTFSSLSEFQDKIGIAKEKALQSPFVGQNAFGRCHLPLPIPRIPELAELSNLGQVLEKLLEAVDAAYKNEFPSRDFYNHQKGTLADATFIVPDMRQDNLLILASKAPQAGILLPNSMQGFSIEADIAIIQFLPDFISLAGIEYLLAIICYPDILARDWHAPGLLLSALSWKSPDRSFLFWAGDVYLHFAAAASLALPGECCSGGLFLLG